MDEVLSLPLIVGRASYLAASDSMPKNEVGLDKPLYRHHTTREGCFGEITRGTDFSTSIFHVKYR